MKVELIKTIDCRNDVWYHVEKDGKRIMGITQDVLKARGWYEDAIHGKPEETREVLDSHEA